MNNVFWYHQEKRVFFGFPATSTTSEVLGVVVQWKHLVLATQQQLGVPATFQGTREIVVKCISEVMVLWKGCLCSRIKAAVQPSQKCVWQKQGSPTLQRIAMGKQTVCTIVPLRLKSLVDRGTESYEGKSYCRWDCNKTGSEFLN